MSRLDESTPGTAEAAVDHPLAPLTPDEIRAAVALVRDAVDDPDDLRFPLVSLYEPTKDELRAWRSGEPLDRRVDLMVVDRAKGTNAEVVVSVTRGLIDAWSPAPAGAQPPMTPEECLSVEAAAKRDPRFVAACERRGVPSMEHVMVDAMSAGSFDFEGEDGLRLARGVAYWRRDEDDNGYAYPIENVTPIVDVTTGEVIDVWEGPVIPLPEDHGRFDVESVGGTESLRQDLKPLDVVQPDGVSFSVSSANLLEWQKWSMRLVLDAREGLVLHEISYDGRPILHRASLAEMTVPYGDPTRAHFFRAVFDAGEYGLGRAANSLELGCDCLGVIRYLDADLCDERGEVTTIRNAICIHEEDDGILWKHFEPRNGKAHVRRSRKLVVSYIATIGNYDYAFYWYFFQDGTIEHELKATGIMQVQALAEASTVPEYGTLVGRRLSAMHHQHFVNYRLDFDIDGSENSVYEVDTVPQPIDPERNPYGNLMQPVETRIERERDAARDIALDRNRYWKIVSSTARNELGTSTAYKLIPGHNATMACHPDSSLARRASFTGHHLWVTQYDPAERYAAGLYPNQSDPARREGLPSYQQQDRPLADQDVVVWYTFGSHHIPRPEDWPVMPVEKLGFKLKPSGFFHRNPALDAPLPHAGGCARDGGHCGS